MNSVRRRYQPVTVPGLQRVHIVRTGGQETLCGATTTAWEPVEVTPGDVGRLCRVCTARFERAEVDRARLWEGSG